MTRRTKANPRGTFSQKMAWFVDTHGEGVLAGIEGAEQLTEAQKAEVLERTRERFGAFGVTRKRRFRR